MLGCRCRICRIRISSTMERMGLGEFLLGIYCTQGRTLQPCGLMFFLLAEKGTHVVPRIVFDEENELPCNRAEAITSKNWEGVMFSLRTFATWVV